MISSQKIIKSYAHFITKHPVISFIIIIIITSFAIYQAGNVNTKSMDNEDVIPDDITVKKGFDIIGDEFSGSDSIMISIELDPVKTSSIRDLREKIIIDYINKLTIKGKEFNEIESATSVSSIIKDINNNKLPKSKEKIKEIIKESTLFSNYINPDYDHTLVRFRLNDDYEEKELIEKLEKLVENTKSPGGIHVSIAGDLATGPILEEKLGPDMQKTSMYSMAGIFMVLLIIFGRLRYSLTPLSVIIVGIIWAYGFFGTIGTQISPATSGAMSMIMGIGIDFGIQTVNRFRQELRTLKPEQAMVKTLRNVLNPMFTTTLAALIGFQAMSMGNLSVMQELGTMMSFGVTACFLAAISVVPVISILAERIKGGKKNEE
ncbi:MAG: MMPL family transporter [Nanobdellota archaeon]